MAKRSTVAAGVSEAVVEWHPMVKDLPEDERPRERLARLGAEQLTTSELVAIILRGGVHGLSVTRLAERLVTKYRGLTGIARAPISELCAERGIGEAKAVQLKAAIDLGRRFAMEQPDARLQVKSPNDVDTLLRLEMMVLEHEQFRVVLLDTKNRVLATRTLYNGTVNSSTIRVGEVFREAVRHNATAIVAVHNHPSGDPNPSPEDIRVTESLDQAGKLLEVNVLDHIIIGTRCFSMKEHGLGFR